MTYRKALSNNRKFKTPQPIRMIGIMLLCAFSWHAHADTTDYGMYPFASTSIWKTPLGTGATYQSLDDTESALLRNQNAGCANCAYPWVQGGAFGVYQAKSTDNVMLWTYKARPGQGEWPYSGSYTNGSFSIPTPEGIEFLGSTDRHVVIVAPDKKSAIEVWHGAYNATTKTYSGDFIAYMDLTGSGISPTDGIQISIRAYGGSLIGGIVRKEELDSGAINHPLAMVISPQQLRKGELVSSASTRRNMSTQKVWPATTTDGLGYNTYSGSIPMGALFALPADTDIDSLGLTTDEGKTLAKAYKYYGGYVVDAGINTTSIAALEASCTDEQLQHLQTDKRKILNKLVMVTNNSAEHIGGPGSRLIDVDNQSSSIDINTSTSSDTTTASSGSSSTDTTSTSTGSSSETTTDTTAASSSTTDTTGTTASSGTSASTSTTDSSNTSSSSSGSDSTASAATDSTNTTNSTGTTSSSSTTDTTAVTGSSTASSDASETTAVTTSLATGTSTTSDTTTDSTDSTNTSTATTTSTSTGTSASTSSTKTKTTSSSGSSSSGSSSGSSSSSSTLSDSSSTSTSPASTTTSGVISYGADSTTTDASILNELKQTLLTDATKTSTLQASTPTGATVVTTSSATSCSQVSCFKAGSLGDSATTEQNTLVAAGK